ncbi:hypothetical protein CR513_45076, partial [Mucuna pruriens]
MKKIQEVHKEMDLLRGQGGPNFILFYIRTTLKGRKKLSHIEGSRPPRDDPKFEAWDDEDSLIITWLWNSMTPEIRRN